MKTIIAILFVLFTMFQTTFTQELYFETKLYVTDSKGNIDSITVGYSPNINTNYNPEYGEIIDNSPLDSVLEIRGIVIDFNNDFAFFTKKLVSICHTPKYYNEMLCYRTVERMFLTFHAKYPPVTISWDRDTWAEECTAGSWITTMANSETITGWYQTQDTSTYSCMGLNSSVTWTLPYTRPQSEAWRWVDWYRVHEIEGGRLDTLPFIQIAPKYRYFFDTPCWVSPVSTEDVIENSFFDIMPNPAWESISIRSTEQYYYMMIYNLSGVLEKSLNYSDVYDVSDLCPGMKIMKIFLNDGKIYTRKFIKL